MAPLNTHTRAQTARPLGFQQRRPLETRVQCRMLRWEVSAAGVRVKRRREAWWGSLSFTWGESKVHNQELNGAESSDLPVTQLKK